jgi:hypothetical protein
MNAIDPFAAGENAAGVRQFGRYWVLVVTPLTVTVLKPQAQPPTFPKTTTSWASPPVAADVIDNVSVAMMRVSRKKRTPFFTAAP